MSQEQDKKLSDKDATEAMMPWIERGQLNEDDKTSAADQLASSSELRDELAFERKLADVMEDIGLEEIEAAEQTNDAAWTKFKARLESETAAETQPQMRPKQTNSAGQHRASAWRRFRLPQTSLGWLATAQTAAIAAMAFVLMPSLQSDPSGEFVTLSSAGEDQLPSGNAVLVVAPETSTASLNAMVESSGARIVDGPMANGGYVLAFDDEQLASGIALLKESEDVVFAQALSDGEQP